MTRAMLLTNVVERAEQLASADPHPSQVPHVAWETDRFHRKLPMESASSPCNMGNRQRPVRQVRAKVEVEGRRVNRDPRPVGRSLRAWPLLIVVIGVVAGLVIALRRRGHLAAGLRWSSAPRWASARSSGSPCPAGRPACCRCAASSSTPPADRDGGGDRSRWPSSYRRVAELTGSVAPARAGPARRAAGQRPAARLVEPRQRRVVARRGQRDRRSAQAPRNTNAPGTSASTREKSSEPMIGSGSVTAPVARRRARPRPRGRRRPAPGR